LNPDKTSIFISLILRHKPETIGIKLDQHGWANVDELINKINTTGKYHIDTKTLNQIVDTDTKQRYSFNHDGTLIRANQGHSIDVDVELKKAKPPEILYHGTGEKYTDSIMRQGLISKNRLYVHLSTNITTAKTVGKRHGESVVFRIKTKNMYADGYAFYLSSNGIWLTHNVPTEYLNRI